MINDQQCGIGSREPTMYNWGSTFFCGIRSRSQCRMPYNEAMTNRERELNAQDIIGSCPGVIKLCHFGAELDLSAAAGYLLLLLPSLHSNLGTIQCAHSAHMRTQGHTHATKRNPGTSRNDRLGPTTATPWARWKNPHLGDLHDGPKPNRFMRASWLPGRMTNQIPVVWAPCGTTILRPIRISVQFLRARSALAKTKSI